MKKLTLLPILLLTYCSVEAQQYVSINQVTGSQGVFDRVVSTTGKNLNYDEIKGSPYYNRNFFNAKIGENYENVPARYNSYKDDIEFKKGEEIQVLPKESKFSRIEFTGVPKETIVLMSTDDENNGYFFELVNGKNKLYKKVKTKFVDVVPAASSYATEKPANFRTLDPIYYIKTEKGFIQPKNKKVIIDAFPESKTDLDKFFSQTKIKFDKEGDLIKVVEYLNQN